MIQWFMDWWPYMGLIVAAAIALLTVNIWLPIATLVWGVLPNWLRIVLGAVAAVGAAFLLGKHRGSRNEQTRQKERDVKAVYRRQETNAAVDKLTPAQKNKELSTWERD